MCFIICQQEIGHKILKNLFQNFLLLEQFLLKSRLFQKELKFGACSISTGC